MRRASLTVLSAVIAVGIWWALAAANISVATGPGATTFTVMLREANSRARERARPTRPALEAA